MYWYTFSIPQKYPSAVLIGGMHIGAGTYFNVALRKKGTELV